MITLRDNLHNYPNCPERFDYFKHFLKTDLYYPNQTTKIEFRDTPASKPPQDCLTSYDKSKILIGNWYEERSDVRFLRQGEPITGEYSHLYCTTYDTNYNKSPVYEVPEKLKNFRSYPTKRIGLVYPTYQPELNPDDPNYYHWSTTYLTDFIRHKHRRQGCEGNFN